MPRFGGRSVSVYLFRRGTKQFIFIISIFTKFQINFIKCVHVGRGNETSNSPPLGLGGCGVTRDLWYLRGNDTNNKSLQFCVLNYSEAFTHLAHLVGWNLVWFKSWMWGRVGENALHIFWKWKKETHSKKTKHKSFIFGCNSCDLWIWRGGVRTSFWGTDVAAGGGGCLGLPVWVIWSHRKIFYT